MRPKSARPEPSVTKTVARAARVALVVAALALGRAGGADEAPEATASIWDGVYTQAQVERGRGVYTGPCSHCHGYKLDGAPDDPDMFSTPPLAGAKFLRDWDGRSLAVLFEYSRTTMPENNPSYLSDQEYADVIAYMLAASGVPAGDKELEGDPGSLARVVIRQQR